MKGSVPLGPRYSFEKPKIIRFVQRKKGNPLFWVHEVNYLLEPPARTTVDIIG